MINRIPTPQKSVGDGIRRDSKNAIWETFPQQYKDRFADWRGLKDDVEILKNSLLRQDIAVAQAYFAAKNQANIAALRTKHHVTSNIGHALSVYAELDCMDGSFAQVRAITQALVYAAVRDGNMRAARAMLAGINTDVGAVLDELYLQTSEPAVRKLLAPLCRSIDPSLVAYVEQLDVACPMTDIDACLEHTMTTRVRIVMNSDEDVENANSAHETYHEFADGESPYSPLVPGGECELPSGWCDDTGTGTGGVHAENVSDVDQCLQHLPAAFRKSPAFAALESARRVTSDITEAMGATTVESGGGKAHTCLRYALVRAGWVHGWSPATRTRVLLDAHHNVSTLQGVWRDHSYALSCPYLQVLMPC